MGVRLIAESVVGSTPGTAIRHRYGRRRPSSVSAESVHLALWVLHGRHNMSRYGMTFEGAIQSMKTLRSPSRKNNPDERSFLARVKAKNNANSCSYGVPHTRETRQRDKLLFECVTAARKTKNGYVARQSHRSRTPPPMDSFSPLFGMFSTLDQRPTSAFAFFRSGFKYM